MTNSTLRLPFKELLKSVPGFFGIRLEEEPRYDVVDKDGEIEVRRYAPALLAEVTVARQHDAALDEGFDILAKYIFGENGRREQFGTERAQDGETMEMTTPVTHRHADGAWTISFFLGNDMTPAEAPAPKDPRVKLRLEEARTVAVARYTGNNDKEKRTAARAALLQWVDASSKWSLDGQVFWAQYDAPFVIPFLKRNEAQVEVVRTAD